MLYKKARHLIAILILLNRARDMINTGDKLICTNGNPFFVEGQVYTVGSIINQKFFEIEVEDGDHWYATKDSEGIYVRFNSLKGNMSDAWFTKVKLQAHA